MTVVHGMNNEGARTQQYLCLWEQLLIRPMMMDGMILWSANDGT